MSGRYVPINQQGVSALAWVSGREISSEPDGKPATVPAQTLLTFPEHAPITFVHPHLGVVASEVSKCCCQGCRHALVLDRVANLGPEVDLPSGDCSAPHWRPAQPFQNRRGLSFR